GIGAAGPPVIDELFEIVREPICTQEIAERLRAPQDGAVVVFEGIVRNHSAGRRTLYLDYEAYEPMAIAKMREIGATMRTQFPINHIALVHRVGRLAIGETSVLIAVSSAHRGPPFYACPFGLDTLKRVVSS